MITRIILNQKATFTGTPQTLDCDSNVNIIYGANGSGKTTISKLINNPISSYHSTITSSNSDSISLVYNIDFVDNNFNQDIKGIFTLGKDDADIFKNIKNAKDSIDSFKKEKDKKFLNLEDKKLQRNARQKQFYDRCWDVRNSVDDDFKPALTGFRGVTKTFGKKCVEECLKDQPESLTYDELAADIKVIYGADVQKLVEIPMIDTNSLGEDKAKLLLSERVVGKEDVDLAALIKKLGNANWVYQGKRFLEENEGVCPFCQEELSRDLNSLITDFFDESYQKKLKEISQSKSRYLTTVKSIVDRLSQIASSNLQYVDNDKLALLLQRLISGLDQNLAAFDNKLKEAGEPFEYHYLKGYLVAVNEVLSEANAKVRGHNTKVDGAQSEKSAMVIKVWAYISKELKADYKTYELDIINLGRAVKGMDESINKIDASIKSEESKLLVLEEQITSTEHTVNEINTILSGYHFEGFKIGAGDNKGTYKIVRSDGADARNTLSEGEKTFVTFLYFYHLLKGSVAKVDISKDRIVVFDDPISSLDSNVLFIVSNLIRKLIDQVMKNEGFVKQVFILTHNVYFHKEVSYKIDPCKHWVVSKLNNISTVKEYDTNPIKSSYQLLWQQLKEVESTGSVTLPNILRRILETYFKLAGKFSFDSLIDKFVDEEKILCHSLISWIHDGSHNINDDLYVESSVETIEKYLLVFKKVFVESGHGEHYDMMMAN